MQRVVRTSGAIECPDLRADCPSAENRRPFGATSGDLGNLPSSAPWGRRFGSDLLCQTGWSRSTRSMGLPAGLAEPSPTRFRSRRLFRSHPR